MLLERGLTRSQYAVLKAIDDTGTTLGFLAKHAGRDPSNITGIVDRLEQSGWVRRDKDPRDRRVITVGLTDDGIQLKEMISEIHSAKVHQRLSVLSEDEQRLLLQLMGKLKVTENEI